MRARAVDRRPEMLELRLRASRERAAWVAGTLELEVQLVDGRLEKRDG